MKIRPSPAPVARNPDDCASGAQSIAVTLLLRPFRMARGAAPPVLSKIRKRLSQPPTPKIRPSGRKRHMLNPGLPPRLESSGPPTPPFDTLARSRAVAADVVSVSIKSRLHYCYCPPFVCRKFAQVSGVTRHSGNRNERSAIAGGCRHCRRGQIDSKYRVISKFKITNA